MVHGTMMMRGTTFFSVLVAFFFVFVLTVQFKAVTSALLSTKGGETRGRASIELASRMLSLVLAYVQFLLVQIVTARSNAFINDGHFQLESLVLPVVIFLLFYVLYHSYNVRMRSVLQTAPR